jgi:hypothetical protein
MKLMMMSSKKGMRGVIHRERIGVAASTIIGSTTSSLWHSNGSGKASTWMIPERSEFQESRKCPLCKEF